MMPEPTALPPSPRAMPGLSLLVCTLGRAAQLTRLLDSLAAQDCGDFDIVLVDQNPPGTLDSLIAPYRDRLTIDHVFSEKGLSRSRNVGLRRCRGALVAFPDDDCWYPPTLVGHVIGRFGVEPAITALTGRTFDANGRASLGIFLTADQPITKHNIWFSGNSNSFFVRGRAARDVGGFDEALGVGASTPFKSGEETDFLLRIIAAGGRAAFRRDLIVHHDQVAQQGGAASAQRAIGYSRGFGRVLRLHRYGIAYLALRVMRSFTSCTLAVLRRDRDEARYKALWAIGTLRGYFAAMDKEPQTGKRNVKHVLP